MAKSFAQQVCEKQRMWILRLLNDADGYRADTQLMQDYLISRGVGCSLAVVTDALLWLADQMLIRIDVVEDSMIGQLRQEGQDVANGLSKVPGVARPAPRSDWGG